MVSIYPKLAASRPIAVNEGTCFLLMPFVKEMRPVHAAIKDVCEGLSLKCERADDIYSQRPIFSTILDAIIASEVIVADLTGKNPNVFYEIGIAHSLREPQSVILASQSIDDVPFDLRHLPIILYRLENMERFEIELERRIRHSRAATQGVNFALNYLFPLHFYPHDVRSFIDYANELSVSFFTLIAHCLRPDATESEVIDAAGLQEVLRMLTLLSEANNSRWRKICDYLRLEILCTERLFDLTKGYCSAYLQKTSVSQFDLKQRDDDHFVAELCFKLIERDLAKTHAINWLLDYLHNPRMGTIDVVRYKIETFIVESSDGDLDASLLALLSAKSPSIREAAADMIGQKDIGLGGKYLMQSLATEENPYAARSMITALARQNMSDAVETIVEWVERHSLNWWKEPISATLRRVCVDAVRKLDKSGVLLARALAIPAP